MIRRRADLDEPLTTAELRLIARLREYPAERVGERERLRARLRAVDLPTRARGTSAWRRAAHWWWLTVPAAASLALLAGREGGVRQGGGGDAKAPARSVEFRLRVSGARQVHVVGDFNNWNSRGAAMHRDDDGWSITIALPRGRYTYAFLVDGVWTADADAPNAPDGFGLPTSVVVVSPRGDP